MPGKLRLFGEPFAGRPPDGDETIHEFAARRIGTEAASIMVDAMVSGVFAGNAHALSLRASFPRMWQLEAEYGSLFRALLATRRRRTRDDAVGAPAGRLTSFDDGMEVLVAALASSLGPALRTSSPLTRLQKMHLARAGRAGASIHYLADTPAEPVDADAVVLAGPSATAAEVVRPFDPALATLLAGITSAPLAVVCLGYATTAVEADRGTLNGFGFLAPRGEHVRILGALWETSIYSGRAPEGKTLVRVMIGGALDPSAVALDDDALVAAVREDLAKTMGLRARPELVRIIRHRRGIPQYTVGHLDRLQRIDARLQEHPGLFLAGNSYRGVAINSCIAEAGSIADQVLAYVRPAGIREERSA
jgi:protoporphyrinogen/coproporphyrinogen III oxidase